MSEFEIIEATQSEMKLADEIEDAEIAPEPKPKTQRTRARSAAKAKGQAGPNPAKSLIDAVKFVSIAQTKTGTVNETHCHLADGWIAATNGVLTVATKIEEDLRACPQTAPFLAALGKVETDLSIVQLSQGFVSVASGDFRGVVPCAPADQVPIAAPDAPCADIDDRVRHAFAAVVKIPDEGSPRAELACALLQSGSAVATNGSILIEYWHGIDLPPNLLIPKVALQAIIKTKKTLDKLGFSPSSVTFWFTDGSFIKTQIFNAQYPAYKHVVDCDFGSMWPVPEDFFKAVDAVSSFGENTAVYFKNGQVVSDPNDETPSFYRVDGLPENVGFSGAFIKMISGLAEKLYFEDEGDLPKLFFVGNNVRGVIAGLAKKAPNVYRTEHEDPWLPHDEHNPNCQCPDCEIPF